MVGFRCLYNQGSTHSINKLEDKKIHIFYIKKKLQISQMSLKTKKKKWSPLKDGKEEIWNGTLNVKEFYFTRPIFLASVSYINNLHILTIKTSASSSST